MQSNNQTRGKIMKISNKLLMKIQESIRNMFVEYQISLEEAYLMAGDDPLSITIGIKISPEKGQEKVVTNFSFVKERCKDSVTAWVDEDQGELFEK